MKTPTNYLQFIRLFPNLTRSEQLRLLSLLARPSDVHRALRTIRGEAYIAVKAVKNG